MRDIDKMQLPELKKYAEWLGSAIKAKEKINQYLEAGYFKSRKNAVLNRIELIQMEQVHE